MRLLAGAIVELDREVSVDASIVRAHQHAAAPHRGRANPAAGRASHVIVPSAGPVAESLPGS
ncbi:hypothetical protein, partial [Actinokineospora sp. NBRC 105648]|uniref:hypothetical protein n=1 Tax=Actinokineospora sp. NBRC 105648 TaxID=3032206 RepID=UPI002554D669